RGLERTARSSPRHHTSPLPRSPAREWRAPSLLSVPPSIPASMALPQPADPKFPPPALRSLAPSTSQQSSPPLPEKVFLTDPYPSPVHWRDVRCPCTSRAPCPAA